MSNSTLMRFACLAGIAAIAAALPLGGGAFTGQPVPAALAQAAGDVKAGGDASGKAGTMPAPILPNVTVHPGAKAKTGVDTNTDINTGSGVNTGVNTDTGIQVNPSIATDPNAKIGACMGKDAAKDPKCRPQGSTQ